MLSKKNIALLAIILAFVVLLTIGCKSVKTKEEFEEEFPQGIPDDETEEEEDETIRETLYITRMVQDTWYRLCARSMGRGYCQGNAEKDDRLSEQPDLMVWVLNHCCLKVLLILECQ